jgi:hypothetical protein
VQYCFDYSILDEAFDNQFARFNLHEKTGDKCHYYVLWNDKFKGPVLQYKLYRYSIALYPRMYMEGQEHEFEGIGLGKVLSSKPLKDPVTKDKSWQTEVMFRKPSGEDEIQLFTFPANDHAIQIFYETPEHPLPTAADFRVAAFYVKFDAVKRAELEENIGMMVEKCQLNNDEKTNWNFVLQSIPSEAALLQNVELFALPSPQAESCYRQPKSQNLPIDTGIRSVDVVTHTNFRERDRQRTLKVKKQDNEAKMKLEPLKKGDFAVLQVGVTNCVSYPFEFVVGQVIEDLSTKDTTNPDTVIQFQIYRPSTLDNLSSKMVPWIGDTNKPWKDDFARGLVKALVQLQPQGKKLTSNSRKLIENAFF